MKLTIDELIELARSLDGDGQIPYEVEQYLNLIVAAEEDKVSLAKISEEYGEDLVVASVKVLTRESSKSNKRMAL